MERDLNNHGDNYSATGMPGLKAINLNPNLQRRELSQTLAPSSKLIKLKESASMLSIVKKHSNQRTLSQA